MSLSDYLVDKLQNTWIVGDYTCGVLDTSIFVVIDSNVEINGAPKYMKKTTMITTIKEDVELFKATMNIW